jgi:AcrR family transcriptional regulator
MFVMGIAERKSRQKQALRERILDAARRIVIREGFAALSMRKIADAIEYSPATLYLHFASRDEIAQALCEEGYAQLLETFVPLAQIADPAERLKAIGRAYVAFGVAHPQTYRLIFMEDPSYTGAALGGSAGSGSGTRQVGAHASSQVSANAVAERAMEGVAAAAADGAAENAAEDLTTHVAKGRPPHATDAPPTLPDDDAGAASLYIMISALDELKAAGRLPASVDVAVWAEALWATMHGIVALNLTCPVFPTAPLDTVVSVALDAWLGAAQPVAPASGGASATHANRASAGRKQKPASARTASSAKSATGAKATKLAKSAKPA